VRGIAKGVAEAYYAQRERLGFPGLKQQAKTGAASGAPKAAA